MDINAVTLNLLRIPSEYTQEYNRWYDLDHLAEHVSKADVIMGRRYVATRDLQQVEGVQRSTFTDGHPPYLTIYSFGGPLDFRSDEARELWRVMDNGIVRAGRYWQKGRAVHNSAWRLASARARASVLVAPAAIPHLAHRGVIVAIGRAPSVERRQAAVDWWERTHLVDLLATPGVLAGIRFDPATEGQEDLLLHLILCEDPPADVMASIEAMLHYQGAIGRYPAFGGVYESIAFLPYERIVPLEYDFDIDDEDN